VRGARTPSLVVIAALALFAPAASTAVAARPPAAPVQAAVPVQWQRPVVSAAGLVQRSGVRLVRVAVTGGGGLLDVRYQVVDPDKAATVHEAATPPAVVDEASGLVVSQLLMGHSHTGPMKAAATYYLVFENPGGWIHRGSSVAVLLGDAQVDHVLVT
jgi:hypothetical protein